MAKGADAKLRLRAQDRMSRTINKVSRAFPKLSRAVRKSSLEFKKFERDNRRVTKALSKTGRKMVGIGRSATMSLTAPIALVGAMAIRTGVNFEKGMNKVQSVTQASASDMKAMREEAKKLGSTTAFRAGEAADAMAFLGQAGWKTNQIMKGIGPTLDLAAASGTDLARSADIMSNVMGGFGLEAERSADVSNILSRATASANIDMEMIAETMKDAAPVAKKFGATLSETAALTGKLGDAGIQGSKAGTTLKQMFISLAAPSKRTKDLFSSLGVKAIDPATGKLKKMTDILVDLNKGFESKGIKGAKKLAILNEIFGKRAIAGAGVLLDAVKKLDPETGKYVNTVAKLEEKLGDVNVTAKLMAEQRLKGLGGAFTKLASSFEGVQLAILDLEFGGKKLSVRITELVGGVTKFFQEISTTNKGLLKTIVVIAGVVAVMGPILMAIGSLLIALPFLISGIQAAVIAFGMFKLAVSASLIPLLPYIAAAAIIAATGIAIYKNWSTLKAFFSDFWDRPLEQLKDMVNWAGQLAGLNPFGDSSDDVDAKLRAQGFKIGTTPQGKETSAKKALDQSKENKVRENKASLAIQFSGDRQGTKIIADDRGGMLDMMTGAI